MGRTSRTLLSLTAFASTIVFWRWSLGQSFSPVLNWMCIIGAVLAVYPAVWLGRMALDRKPTIERAAWVTAAEHAGLMVLFGTAIIKAIQTAEAWRGIVLPLPRSVTIVLVQVTGLVSALTVVNLAVRGLGAPFAIALSRRLATDWLYARTRNPMVLSVLVWLVAVGLWLQSALFLLWLLVLVTPAWIFFLKVYEERELELRFGDAYRAYRDATPFLWPR